MDRYVDVPGGRLYAEEEGSGPPLILIHAAIVNLRAWDAGVPGFVAAGYRVIRYDMRGFGRSETADVEFSERDDLRAVMDAFGVKRTAVVGNSRGGSLAMDTAIESPERFVAVVTLGSGPGGFAGPAPTPVELELYKEEERLGATSPRDPDAVADFMVRLWVDGAGQPADRLSPSIRESVRGMARPLFVPGHVSARPVRLTPPADSRLAELRCPVLAIVGGMDISYEVAAVRRLAEAAPNARALVWPDVAHMIGMEQPERLVREVADFLAPLRPWD